jgi:small-conductance mechanosensitive channel
MKILCLPIFIVFGILLATSCHVQKGKTKSYLNKDSVTIANLERHIEDLETENTFIRKRLQEMEYLGVEMQPCPQINLDSLRAAMIAANCSPEQIAALTTTLAEAETTIRKQADGTLEIKGKVQRLTQTKSTLEETILSQKSEISRLTTELQQQKSQVKTEVKTVDKFVDRWYIPWWIWLILAAAVIGTWYFKGWTITRGEAIADARSIIIRKPQK